jgi:hypothetical protein
VAAVVWIVYGWSGSVWASVAAFALVVGLAAAMDVGDPPQIYHAVLASNWPPDFYVPTFLAFIVTAASVAAGRASQLWLLAVTGWLLVHGHAAFLFFVPVISVAVAVFALWPARRAPWAAIGQFLRRGRSHYVPALLISAVFALPLAAALFLHWPGQFGKYVQYARAAKRSHHTIGEAIRYLLWFWAPGPLWLAAVATAGTVTAAAVVVWRLGRTAGPAGSPLRRFLGAAIWICAVATACMFYYAWRGIDYLHATYIGFFYWSVPLFMLMVVATGLAALGNVRAVTKAAAVFALVVALVAGALSPGFRADVHDNEPALLATMTALAARAHGRLIVLHVQYGAGFDAGGLVLQAERLGAHACLMGSYAVVFRVTSQFLCHPARTTGSVTYWLRRRPYRAVSGIRVVATLRYSVLTTASAGSGRAGLNKPLSCRPGPPQGRWDPAMAVLSDPGKVGLRQCGHPTTLGCQLAGSRHDRGGSGRGLDPLAGRRPHLELYIRWMREIRHFKPSTVSRAVLGHRRVLPDRRDRRPAGALTRRARPPALGPTSWSADRRGLPVGRAGSTLLRLYRGHRHSPRCQDHFWFRGPFRHPDDGRQVRAINGLPFEKEIDNPGEGVQILAQQHCRPALGLPEQLGYFPVDGSLRLLGIGTASERVIPARSFRTVADRPDFGGEAPFPHHAGGQIGRTGEVIRGTGRWLPENDDLRSPAAQPHRERIGEVAPGIQVAFGLRQLLGHAERRAAGEDGDLRHWVGVLGQDGDERMAGFVHGDRALFLGQQRVGAIAPADQQPVPGRSEVSGGKDIAPIPHGVDRRFVHEVGEISARESRCPARHRVEIHIGAEFLAPPVDSQDRHPLLLVGQRDFHRPVEAAGPQQGRVEDLGPVGRPHHHHAGARLESIHIGQKLVEGLLALVVRAEPAGTAAAADGVDLIDEDDRWSMLAGVGEKTSHP